MHIVHHVNEPSLNPLAHTNPGNSLGFEKINYNWDHAKRQLILSIKTHRMINYDVKAVLKGNRLMFEAPLLLSYNKPFRTHLIEPETREEYEDGFTVNGYSQIRLNHGYKYRLISCRVMDTKKIRVVLDYKRRGSFGVS
jgi:hypothetical protein